MKRKEKTMDELIMEEIKRNPILTEEELAEMMKPLSEEDIRREEELTAAIFERVEKLEEELGYILSVEEFKKVAKEEEEKLRQKYRT